MDATHLFNNQICIKGAGEMASGVACRLYNAGFRRMIMLEIDRPIAVRRAVSFCEAVYDGRQTVESITAEKVTVPDQIAAAWSRQTIPVLVDPDGEIITRWTFDVIIDAILAKKNLGTRKSDADLVMALGPGFEAGNDVDCVVETQRGHQLGRIYWKGSAAPNTGVPGEIGGYSSERVLRSPCDGSFKPVHAIGDPMSKGEVIGHVDGSPLTAELDGILRGLIRTGIPVRKGMKIGDIDPRGDRSYCYTISEKSRAIGGAVLEAMLHHWFHQMQQVTETNSQ